MPTMTTTANRFKVEDVTFRNARRQSEIDNEIDKEEVQEDEVKAPVSLTHEQVTLFYKHKIEASHDSNEKRVYAQTIRWLNEYQNVKKELVAMKEKEIARSEEEAAVNDIVEDSNV